MIKNLSILIFFSLNYIICFSQNNDSTTIARIYHTALTKGLCYENLGQLCSKVGGRLSGSPQANKAVELMEHLMKEQKGFDSVWLQPVMVPHWVRGKKESASVFHPHLGYMKLNIIALGGSVATPEGGIKAELIMVDSVADLAKLGEEKIKGKIVFFNRPMDPAKIFTFEAYGGAVDQRWAGPSTAAKYGAVGTICRSMEVGLSDHPHTGSMRYDTLYNKIPCAAISTNDAEKLSKWLQNTPNIQLQMQMHCETLPDVLSYNVVGEIKGSEKPQEIIIVGGHLDSWDNGDGAQDDGAGCVQSMEVANIYKHLNLKPKRTIRVVLFMNEENGLRGGKKYAELAKANKEKHIAAIETDEGGFTPRGFNATCDSAQWKVLYSWAHLFKPYWVNEWQTGGGGADIGPLRDQGVALIGFIPDPQRYFDFHHTDIDQFKYVNKRELELGSATISSLIWLLSEYGF